MAHTNPVDDILLSAVSLVVHHGKGPSSLDPEELGIRLWVGPNYDRLMMTILMMILSAPLPKVAAIPRGIHTRETPTRANSYDERSICSYRKEE